MTDQQVPSTVTASIVTEKKRNSLLVIGLLILLIVFIGIAGYFAYQKCQLKNQPVKVPSNTITPPQDSKQLSNITDFTSVRNSYSFNYDKHEFSKSLSDNKARLSGPDGFSFEVEVIETDFNSPEEWWRAQKVDSRNNLLVDDFTIQETTISNQPAIKIIPKLGKWPEPGGLEELYLIINNKKLFKLRVDPSSGKIPLSSFRFL